MELCLQDLSVSSWCGQRPYLYGIIVILKAGMLSELLDVTPPLSALFALWKVQQFVYHNYSVHIFCIFHTLWVF